MSTGRQKEIRMAPSDQYFLSHKALNLTLTICIWIFVQYNSTFFGITKDSQFLFPAYFSEGDSFHHLSRYGPWRIFQIFKGWNLHEGLWDRSGKWLHPISVCWVVVQLAIWKSGCLRRWYLSKDGKLNMIWYTCLQPFFFPSTNVKYTQGIMVH